MERVWAQYGRKNRIPNYIKKELRLAGFVIRSKKTWLNRTQIKEKMDRIGSIAVKEMNKMETIQTWTCPGEDAGYCDNNVRRQYEGPCIECPHRVIGVVEEVA